MMTDETKPVRACSASPAEGDDLRAAATQALETLEVYVQTYNDYWERGMDILEPQGDAALVRLRAALAAPNVLPKAFSKRSAMLAWIDPVGRTLAIDTSSDTRAEGMVSLLLRAVHGLSMHYIQPAQSPAGCMAAWLMEGEAPQGFTIDRESELQSADEAKALVRYARHSLDTDDLRQHLKAGKVPKKLALSYNDRVSFVLTDAMHIRKLSFLDLAFEGKDKPGADEQFDADVVLATGELAPMIPVLIEALGGEYDFMSSAGGAA